MVCVRVCMCVIIVAVELHDGYYCIGSGDSNGGGGGGVVGGSG